jgi:hypothetical protein
MAQARLLPRAETRTRPEPILRMNPTRVAWYGIATYLAMFLVAPVEVVTPQAIEPYVYIFASFACFFLGCQIVQHLDRRELMKKPAPDSVERLERIHRWVTWASIIGVTLRSVDRFFVRGVTLTGSVLERQADMGAVGSNPVSIASAMFLPATMIVPLTYMLVARAGKGSKGGSILMHCLFAFPILEAATVAGQRSVGFAYIAIYVLYSIYLRRITIKGKHVVIIAIVGIGVLTGATYIFNNRLEAMNMSPLNSIYTSGYAYTVQPQPWVGQFLRAHTGPIGDMAFALILTSQYYVHGFFEFVSLYLTAPDMHLWGALSFNAYYKLYAIFADLPDPISLYFKVTPHPGVYSTFMGPVFSDFGWFGLIYMMALGATIAGAWRVCVKGEIAMVPLYIYMVIVTFLLPVCNFITGSEGLFRINCFLVFYFLFRKRKQPKNSTVRTRLRGPAGFGRSGMRTGAAARQSSRLPAR